MDPILETIDDALRRKGISDAAASKLAVGNYSLIKNMRSARSDEKRYSFHALSRLAEVLGLECYFGPKRETGPVEVIDMGGEYAHLPVYDASLAAGSGAFNDQEGVVDFLAFRRDWLRSIGLDPARAVVARARGDSMTPCICHGDQLLIDRSASFPASLRRSDRRRLPIMALVLHGEAIVKRVQVTDQGLVMLISDNPDYPPILEQAANVALIGKVVWWAHTSAE